MIVNFRSVFSMVLLALMLMLMPLALPGSANAATGAVTNCSACHGYAPVDSATRDFATGRFTGNHDTHFSAGNCQICHNSVGATEYNHSMKSSVAGVNYINMTGIIHNSRMGAASKYNKGVKFAQSSTPTLSTCSNVNCHFETTTPTWGQAAPWSSTKTAANNDANCSNCHSTTGLSSGTHTKHIAAGGATQAACSKCHPDYNSMAGTAAFQHASSGNLPITVTFAAAPNLGGTYTGGRTGNNFLPSAAQSATGSCSALYCHSPGNKASSYDPPNTAPATWGGSLSCKGCHKADFASGDIMVSGSHGRHVGSTVYKIDCVRCHVATVNAGLSIKNVAKHVNGGVDLAFDSSSSAINGTYKGSPVPLAVTPGTLPYGTCGNVYCHSNGQNDTGVGITYKAPVWNTPSTGQCGSCHDVSAGFGHGTVQIATGKHTRHLAFDFGMVSAGDRCTICHDIGNNFTNTGCSNSCHAGAAKHVNNQVDVIIPSNFGASASYSGTPKPGDGYGSCSSVYCHSDGQATPAYAPAISWSAAALSCTACHGGGTVNSPGGTPLSGAHPRHTNPSVNTELGVGNGFGCVECHAKTVSSDTVVNNLTNHVNKIYNYSGARARGSAQYTLATKSCSTLYCHSNGKPGTAVSKFNNPAAWNSGTVNQKCNYCHGRQGHTPAVAFDNDAAFSLFSSTGVPNYTSGAGGTDIANSHRQHMAQMATTDYSNTQVCFSCHSATVDISTGRATTAAKFRPYSSRHASGVINVKFKASIAGTYNGAVGTKTCSATLCHGGTSPKWGANTTNDGCTKCHGTPSASVTNTTKYLVAPPFNTSQTSGTPTGAGQVSNNPKVGAHQTHIQFLNGFSNYSTQTFRCENCHGTLPTTTAHITGSSAPAFQGMATKRGAMSPSWTAASLTCSNTYCHNPAGTGGTLNAANVGTRTFVSWTAASYLGDTAKTETNCNRCHKSPGTVAGTITVTSIISHASFTIATNCTPCHGHNGDTAGAAGRRHLDGIKYGGGNCDACHGYQVGSWAAAPSINIEGKGAHEKHVAYLTTKRFTVSLDPAVDQYASAATTWTNVCGVCHGSTPGNHLNGTVNVAVSSAYYFGVSGSTLYSGTPAVSSATTAKTCSNISCHYFTTPVWSAY